LDVAGGGETMPFAGVFEGVAGICGENWWQIAGKFVVKCVVNVVF
jgi:hypothetical protein